MDAIRINRQAARLAALLLLGLALMGCNAKQPASTYALPVAAAPAPRTLESTLRLHPDAQEIPFNPEIVGDAYGNAVAVWEQFDGTHYSIWGNDRAPVRGWGRAALFGTDASGHAYNPQVVRNERGSAMAVWVQSHDADKTYNIWSSRYEPDTGWGVATLVETDDAGPAYAPRIAIDSSGNAIAVWEQSDGKRVNIRANRFVAGTGWGSSTRIETGKSNAGKPVVAMDAEGNAIAVWHRFDGKRGQLWFNRYVAGGVWGQALLIESKPGYAHSPVIETAGGGHATVVWKQAEGLLTTTWAKHYRVGEGWSAARQGCSPTAHALAVPGQSGGIARPVAGDPEMKSCY